MKSILIWFSILLSLGLTAQTTIYSPPFYLYGRDGLTMHLQERTWTKYSRLTNPIKGIVFASITIDSTGKVESFDIVESTSPTLTQLTEEALGGLIHWMPGMVNREKFIRTQVNIPFVFAGLFVQDVTVDKPYQHGPWSFAAMPIFYTEDWMLIRDNNEPIYDYGPNELINPSKLDLGENRPMVDYKVYELLGDNEAMFYYKPFVVCALLPLKEMVLRYPPIPTPDIIEKKWDSECQGPCEYGKALRYYTEGRYESAAEHFGFAKRSLIKNADLCYMRGQCYMKMGKMKKACIDWKQAAEFGDQPSILLVNEHCGSSN